MRGAIDSAAEQALRAGQIIRRLREFVARGETERIPEDLRRLVEEACALALVGAKEAGVHFTLRFGDNMPSVLADKVQIQQVLVNLIRNAMEAMQQSETRELTVLVSAADANMVQISVRTRARASRPKYCLNSSALSSPQNPMAWAWGFPFPAPSPNLMEVGSGPSRDGRPARISISLCALPMPRDLTMSDDKTVYLIDDDEDVRRAVSFLLGTAGLAVRVYESGVKFLEKLEGLPQGCIVSDVRMPGMDGVELLRCLGDTGATMPVIIMTGHGDVTLAVSAMKAGAVDFIEKPFGDDVLISAVRAALGRLRAADQLATEIARVRSRAGDLSARERQVLDGLLRGLPNKTIAYDLSPSAPGRSKSIAPP